MAYYGRITVTVVASATGIPSTGRTVTLYYGTHSVVGTPSALVGTFTAVGDGSYYYDIDHTDQYTIKVDGSAQTELTDIVFCATDVATYTRLDDVTDSASGADAIGFTKGTYFSAAATTVQAALEELAGTRETDETVGANADDITSILTILGSADVGDLTLLHALTPSSADINTLLDCSNHGLVVADLTKLADVTATAAQINILTGATLSTAELNVLDGISTSPALVVADLNLLAGAAAAGITAAMVQDLDEIGDKPATGVTHQLENIATLWSALQVLDYYVDQLRQGLSQASVSSAGMVLVSHTESSNGDTSDSPAATQLEFNSDQVATLCPGTPSNNSGVMQTAVFPSEPRLKNYVRVRFRAAVQSGVTTAKVGLYEMTEATTIPGTGVTAVADTVTTTAKATKTITSATYAEFTMTYWWVGTVNVYAKKWALALAVTGGGSNKSLFCRNITWKYWSTEADDYAQATAEGEAS